MNWKTILLGLIKGTLAIIADDYVYRARQARTRARKHAPPQPKVDDWAEPTKPAAATPIVIETDEGSHFAASSFIAVEGYAQTRVQKPRQPGESRRTRRKRAGPAVVTPLETAAPCEPATEGTSTESPMDAAPAGPTSISRYQLEVLLDAVVEHAMSDDVYSPTMPALAHANPGAEKPCSNLPSVPVLEAQLFNACRRFRRYQERRRLSHYLTSKRRPRRTDLHARGPTPMRVCAGDDHESG